MRVLKNLGVFTLLLSGSVFAGERPSSVPGLSIGNAHAVDTSGRILRGHEPGGKVSELAQLGVTDVVVLKPDLHGEIFRERQELTADRIQSYSIPMHWDISTPTLTCEQTVEAVNLILSLRARNKKVFFHCTSGEDRTGLIAGLLRMQTQNWSARRAFEQEMCANGYGDGSPAKPQKIDALIQKNLTPIFLLLSKNLNSNSFLRKEACANIGDANLQKAAIELNCHHTDF